MSIGETLTYGLTFRNVGGIAMPVDHVDHLAGVLDDAELTVSPTSDVAEVTAGAVVEESFTIRGEVPVGTTAVVSYSVRVHGQGDMLLENFLVEAGSEPATECTAQTPLCTRNPVRVTPLPPVVDGGAGGMPNTGVDVRGMLTAAALLLLLGAFALLTGRRVRRSELR